MKIPESAFRQGDDAYIEIAPKFWVMDNHKWAVVAWDTSRSKAPVRYDLIHIDFHWDGGNDFHDRPEDIDALRNGDVNHLIALAEDEQLIRYDSFIAPAAIRGYLSSVHFLCYQGDRDGDEGLGPQALAIGKCLERKHSSLDSVLETKLENPVIFDFCLDVFNKSEMYFGSDLWPKDTIEEFLNRCKPLVVAAEIVTLSLSYGFSGTEEDTRALAEFALGKFIEWRA